MRIQVFTKSVLQSLERLLSWPSNKLQERALKNIRDGLRRESPPILRGVWRNTATPKQKKAYWAKINSGEITHGRTGKTKRAWEVVRMGGKPVLTNRAPASPWVYGVDTQQPFLKNWTRVDRLELIYGREVKTVLANDIEKDFK